MVDGLWGGGVLWPYTTMNDEGLPLVPPLPLFQPAVQALNDIPDAPPSSKSTGGDIDMEESDIGYPISTKPSAAI